MVVVIGFVVDTTTKELKNVKNFHKFKHLSVVSEGAGSHEAAIEEVIDQMAYELKREYIEKMKAK